MERRDRISRYYTVSREYEARVSFRAGLMESRAGYLMIGAAQLISTQKKNTLLFVFPFFLRGRRARNSNGIYSSFIRTNDDDDDGGFNLLSKVLNHHRKLEKDR